MKKRANKGLSTVIGSVLFIILITTVVSTIFLALYQFDKNNQTSLSAEEARTQERFIIDAMENDSQAIYVTAIHVNNTGPIAIQLRAVYIDSVLLFETLETINAKEALWITLPPSTPYVPISKITVASERGVKSIAKEGDFIGAEQKIVSYDPYFGPLRLDYEKFFYGRYDDSGNFVDPPGWQAGWSVPRSTKKVVYKITVTDIDARAISLGQYSCLTLVSNSEGGQIPWYIEKVDHPNPPGPVQDPFTIQPQETVTITYRWDPSGNPQSAPSSVDRFRIFLTFYGIFNELDGTTKPYGQTIPFEAVLIT